MSRALLGMLSQSPCPEPFWIPIFQRDVVFLLERQNSFSKETLLQFQQYLFTLRNTIRKISTTKKITSSSTPSPMTLADYLFQLNDSDSHRDNLGDDSMDLTDHKGLESALKSSWRSLIDGLLRSFDDIQRQLSMHMIEVATSTKGVK